MKIKNIIFIFILIMLNINICNAETCDKNEINEFKKEAKNISIEYEYLSDSETLNNYKIIIKNINEDLIISDENYEEWSKDNILNGEITIETSEEEKTFKIYHESCNLVLRKINLKLPRYNYYSETDFCLNLSKYNLEVCDQWYQGKLDDETFYERIEPYLEKENNSIINIIKKNKTIVAIILTTIIMIFIVLNVIRRKRSVLK